MRAYPLPDDIPVTFILGIQSDSLVAAHARFIGDTGSQGGPGHVMVDQPHILEAYTEKADLLAADRDYAGALALSQKALDRLMRSSECPGGARRSAVTGDGAGGPDSGASAAGVGAERTYELSWWAL